MPRLFFAVPIPDTVQREIYSVLTPGHSSPGHSTPGLSSTYFRRIAADNLHITLAFVGDVPPETVPQSLHLLSAPFLLPGASPSIELGGIGSFPREQDPRVIWIGLCSGGDDVRSIHRQLIGRLLDAGIPVDRKPFRAHLTVGYRRRSTPRGVAAETVRTLRNTLDDACWSVPLRVVTLYESTLGATGALHRALGNGSVSGSCPGPGPGPGPGPEDCIS